jgi:hypothetical protein
MVSSNHFAPLSVTIFLSQFAIFTIKVFVVRRIPVSGICNSGKRHDATHTLPLSNLQAAGDLGHRRRRIAA